MDVGGEVYVFNKAAAVGGQCKNGFEVLMKVLVLVVLIAVVLLWATTFLVFPWWVGADRLGTETGLAGDSFGAINALFSGLAFAGIIITLVQQQHQLKLQREELALQRREMQESREEVARAARAQSILAEAQLIAAMLPVDAELTRSNRGGMFRSLVEGASQPGPSYERRLVNGMRHAACRSAAAVNGECDTRRRLPLILGIMRCRWLPKRRRYEREGAHEELRDRHRP